MLLDCSKILCLFIDICRKLDNQRVKNGLIELKGCRTPGAGYRAVHDMPSANPASPRFRFRVSGLGFLETKIA